MALAESLAEPGSFCETDTCPVAYFDLFERTIPVAEARGLFWPKDPTGPLCNCHGLTADERPCKTIKDRVVIEDLHATIYRALGISPKLSYEIEKRPFYVTRDGLGKPVADVFARGI